MEDVSTVQKLIDAIKDKLRDDDVDVRETSLQGCVELAKDGMDVHLLIRPES